MGWKAHSLFLFVVMPVYAGSASFSTGMNYCRNLTAVQEMVFWSEVVRHRHLTDSSNSSLDF